MSAPAAAPGRRLLPGRAGTAAGLLAVAGIVSLRLWVLEPLVVGSDSMEPALPQGGLVLLLKSGSPEERAVPGALVVFPDPGDGHSTVKRVVATGGQTVSIEDSVLVVDGAAVPEPHVDRSRIDGTWFGPVTVPAEHVFVLGDNRSPSVDSRDYGSLPVSAVEATVLLPRGP
ncbi:signal peptidase I [Kocuria sp. KH4]